MHLAILLSGLLPVCLVLAYAVAKTRPDRDSEAPACAFTVGACAAIICVPLEILLRMVLHADRMDPVQGGAVLAIAMAAVPEEVAKFTLLTRIALRHVDVRRGRDVMLQSLAVALGFAAVENVVYLELARHWTTVALLRGALTVPMHGVEGLMMGAFAIEARLDPARRREWSMLAVVAPAVLHAAFDFPVFVGMRAFSLGWLMPVLACIVTVSGAVALLAANRALRRSSLQEFRAAPAGPGRVGERLPGTPALLVASGVGAVLFDQWVRLAAGTPGPPGTAWRIWLLSVLPLMLGLDLLWPALRARVRPGDAGGVARLRETRELDLA